MAARGRGMGQGQMLVQKQKLGQVFHPGLVQSLDILTMNSMDLVDYLQEAALANPLLEFKPPEPGLADQVEAAGESRSGWEYDGPDYAETRESSWGEVFDPADLMVARQEASVSSYLREQLLDQPDYQADAELAGLTDYLISNLDERGYLVAPLGELATELAANPGTHSSLLLNLGLEEKLKTKAKSQPGSSKEKLIVSLLEVQLQAALKLIQSLEPAGIGARDLSDCLLLQVRALQDLADKTSTNENIKKNLASKEVTSKELAQVNLLSQLDTASLKSIISDHLDDLAQGHLRQISLELDLTQEEIYDYLDFISSLEAKPLAGLVQPAEETIYIRPDLRLHPLAPDYDADSKAKILRDEDQTEQKREGQKFLVSLDDASLFELTINPHYQELLVQREDIFDSAKSAKDKKSKELTAAESFYQKKLKEAQDLVQAVSDRQASLVRIGQYLADYQLDFFHEGIKALKPLSMDQVAQALDLHESTISRAVRDKYLASPWGIYPLRFFFDSGIENSTGQKIARRAIQARLHEIITAEDSNHPYSDQAISQILGQEGIPISRRTVAKYREEIKIPASPARRHKNL